MRLVVFTDLGVWQPWGACSLWMQRRLGDRSQAGRGTQGACPRDSWALISERTYPLWARSGWMRDHQHQFETVLVGGHPGAGSGPSRGTHAAGRCSHGTFSLIGRGR